MSYTKEREKMIKKHLMARGITDEIVLGAFRRVPRERFVWEPDRPNAYADQAMRIGHGQTISQPYMVAVMLQHMKVSPGHQVLEGWLHNRPDGRLLEAWSEYIVGLCAKLDPAEKHALRDEVMGRARAVARATGGFLGLGNPISPEEEIVLQELEKAFS